MPRGAPLISIVIPTLNEADALPALLGELKGEATPHEVIVADAESSDGTRTIALRHGARLAATARGRGAQLAAGAAAARGDLILFLHADSRFPRGGLALIRSIADARADIVGGNFRLAFHEPDRFASWVMRFYALIRRFGLYYGDSGIFVRAAHYRALGGYRPIALMEDYDFVRRLERAGPTVCIEDPALVTSARRFRGRRGVSIVGQWIGLHLLFHLGADPSALARLYDSERHRASQRE
ncbi:MAG: TIGR04283 family arsenosugar biosynthesis glycosyltransferase [Rhodospirillales bacterium]